ncbi:MAG: hypothetical protein JO311_02315 [Candidatus Eremiobacteraeota bacterium]|nr:hypothetical protein [Candidatus Eremiobacteraeota bacterium]MBV9263714.1 hypothetical protein [Candidatus Eremiobacteraeota bacterium]
MYSDAYDPLDEAIASLPLEEPPAGLRASILLATAYRPAPLFSLGEYVAMGAIAAFALWLIVLVVMGGGTLFVHTIEAIAATSARALSNGATLVWLAAGGATALWISLFTGFQPAAALPKRSQPPPRR